MSASFDKTTLEKIVALPVFHQVDTFGYGTRKILTTWLGEPGDSRRLSFGLLISSASMESDALKTANAMRDALRWWWLLREMGLWKTGDIPPELIVPGDFQAFDFCGLGV